LTPSEPQPRTGDREEPESLPTSRLRGKWAPTPQSFEKLLACLSPDRDEAGRQYEIVRVKLMRFFEWRASGSPDQHVDETFDRVMRRIDEGENIANLMGYFYQVAKFVFMEALKDQERARVASNTIPTTAPAAQLDDGDSDPRLRCFDRCLDELPVESRNLIMNYYQEEGRTKIDLRKQLADRLNIPLNALRIRTHRIRVSLEKCMTACLAQHA
jgi:DNA-directed RNA polymerase specialized sigma24 family protein